MTTAQREALQNAFDVIRQLVRDVEEDAFDRGFEEGYAKAESLGCWEPPPNVREVLTEEVDHT